MDRAQATFIATTRLPRYKVRDSALQKEGNRWAMGVANALLFMILLYAGGGYLSALLLRGALVDTGDRILLGILLPVLIAVLVYLTRLIAHDRRADPPPDRPADPKLFSLVFAAAFV